MDREFLFENLLEWIRSFSFVQYETDIGHLIDGEVLSEILYDIEPNFFSSEWKEKLTFDPNSNWKLKASNLKKIANAMSDFLKLNLNLSLDNFQFPDINLICERSEVSDMSRLLQLVLLCAVNCGRKEAYIQAIMGMERAVQLTIMRAIQELMNNEAMSESLYDNEEKDERNHDHFKALLKEKEALRQKNHELEIKVTLLEEERASADAERRKRNQQQQRSPGAGIGGSGGDGNKKGGDDGGNSDSMRIRQLQDRVCSLEGEIYKLEHSKEDYKLKSDQFETENMELREKMEHLSVQIVDQRNIKDELDITKERLKTLTGMELTLERYKKHADDTSEIARQNRQLEIENSNYLERIFKLEEEVKKTVSLRSQIEMYKSEISEIQSICSQKEKEFNKADFELRRAQEKLKSLEHDKMNLNEELKRLKEENDDLHLNSYPLGSESGSDPASDSMDPPGGKTSATTMSGSGQGEDLAGLDLMQIPFQMRERVIRLQKEVRQLRQLLGRSDSGGMGIETCTERGQMGGTEHRSREQLVVSLEAAQARIMQLSTENKQLHQDNLMLNARVEDVDYAKASQGPNSALVRIQHEMEQTETKYKGYLEKAKYVIYQLHQRLLELEQLQSNKMQQEELPPAPRSERLSSGDGSDDGDNTAGGTITRADYEALHQAFLDKQQQYDSLQKQFEQAHSIRDEEEKMMVAAWYNLGVRLNREAAQERLTNETEGEGGGLTNGVRAGSGGSVPSSFLARQRMAHLMTAKPGGGSSEMTSTGGGER